MLMPQPKPNAMRAMGANRQAEAKQDQMLAMMQM